MILKGHDKKIDRLLSQDFHIDEHINNISKYKLSFFEEFVICRGLNFALPHKVSPKEIPANTEKAYWKFESWLLEKDRELSGVTLRSTAMHCTDKKFQIRLKLF